MKFTNTLFALFAATSALARSVPNKRQYDINGVQSCIKAIDSAGCPFSMYVDEDNRNVKTMCKIYNNNTCQRIYKKGVHNLPGCGNVDESLIHKYEDKIQESIKRIDELCKGNGKKTTQAKKTTAKAAATKTSAKAVAPTNKSATKSTSTNTVTSTTTGTATGTATTTSSVSATATNVLSAGATSAVVGTATVPVASATPNVNGEIAMSGSIKQVSGSILLSTIGLAFYFLF